MWRRCCACGRWAGAPSGSRAELGFSRNTVRRYIESGGWAAYRKPRRAKVLDGLEDWLAERLVRHRGNADVVRQDLASELGLVVSLRTVERAVAGHRQDLRAQARATVRFETPPGRQLQIDFGETRVEVGGELVRVHLFVATLGWSRRCYVQAFRHERQSAWFDGLEGRLRPLRRRAEGGAAGQRQGPGRAPRRGHA